MNFSTDRDLLAIEPGVFEDVLFASQKRLHVTDALVSGTTLLSMQADFVSAGVDTGSVVLVNGVAHEVLERTNANALQVSLPRTLTTDPGIPGGDGTAMEVIAHIEALGTLEVIYAGAASVTGNTETLLEKAGTYRRRFRQACAAATVSLDTDGDGLPDRRVSLGTTRLSRA